MCLKTLAVLAAVAVAGNCAAQGVQVERVLAHRQLAERHIGASGRRLDRHRALCRGCGDQYST